MMLGELLATVGLALVVTPTVHDAEWRQWVHFSVGVLLLFIVLM